LRPIRESRHAVGVVEDETPLAAALFLVEFLVKKHGAEVTQVEVNGTALEGSFTLRLPTQPNDAQPVRRLGLPETSLLREPGPREKGDRTGP
jgi:hypothetical protein